MISGLGTFFLTPDLVPLFLSGIPLGLNTSVSTYFFFGVTLPELMSVDGFFLDLIKLFFKAELGVLLSFRSNYTPLSYSCNYLDFVE